jgi:hypothetical protein
MVLQWDDGQLTIEANRDCSAYVEYLNIFGKGNLDDQYFDMGTFTVRIQKGAGVLPETLTVYDRATEMTYALSLVEGETGRVCVPYPVLAAL